MFRMFSFRLTLLQVTLFCLCVISFLVCDCVDAAAKDTDLKLWYGQPAAKWLEALPVGNGSLGGMVFGGVEDERIQLNIDSLLAGPPVPEDRVGGY